MARRAAAHARLRLRTRQAATGAVAAAAIAVTATLLFPWRQPSPLPIAPIATVAKPAYEIISDDELLATLRDRPLLVLPQENGGKKIVLLDR